MKNGLKTSQKEAFNNIQMKKIYKSYLVPIIIIKLILLFTFSSQYNSDLFYPFLTSISFENLNPWTFFYEKNLLDNLPLRKRWKCALKKCWMIY